MESKEKKNEKRWEEQGKWEWGGGGCRCEGREQTSKLDRVWVGKEEWDSHRGAREQQCRVRLIWILIHCVPEGEVGDNLPPENGISIWGRGQFELRCSYIMALAAPSNTHTWIQWDERGHTDTDMNRHVKHVGQRQTLIEMPRCGWNTWKYTAS